MSWTSALREAAEAHRFLLTADVTPPRGTALQLLKNQSDLLRQRVHAVNVTENPGASVHMCSLAGSATLLGWGIEPVMQLVCRGRNRLALQSDLLGASALGVQNVLCLTGDEVELGGYPVSANMVDIDAVGLLHAANVMRQEGHLLDGEEIQGPCDFFLGAAADPYAKGDEQLRRLESKIHAGADFIQTQPVFDLPAFAVWLERLREYGILGRVSILAGLLPLRGEGSARYLATRVPGVFIPEAVLRRLETASSQAEGIEMAVETGRALLQLHGVDGLHIMAAGWAEAAPLILETLSLNP